MVVVPSSPSDMSLHMASTASTPENDPIDVSSLMEMDIVVFSIGTDEDDDTTIDADTTPSLRIGAVQENGSLGVLSAWTLEPAYDNSVELVVAEEDIVPGIDPTAGSVRIHRILPENVIGFGSRQVGGGKGPGNPHGEESELLYYVDRDALELVDVPVRPDLEILW